MLVLLFNTKSGLLPSKLQLRWIGPFWIVQKFGDGIFLLGQIDGTINPKVVNGYQLKPNFGQMPPYPFTDVDASANFSHLQMIAGTDTVTADVDAVNLNFTTAVQYVFRISIIFFSEFHSHSQVLNCDMRF